MPGSLSESITLNNGVDMPLLGLGTWAVPDGKEGRRIVADALEVGYRHSDTAMIYKNERSVGAAVRDSGLPREQVFITTKCWTDDMRAGRVREAFDASLKQLGMDYVDLYLLHWAVGDYIDCWREMEKLLDTGRTRAVGVSNFMIPHLDKLLAETSVVPAVNQIEKHPLLQSPALREHCQSRGIVVEAWQPIVKGKVAEMPTLVEIGRRHGKTPVQVALRWALQHNVVVIPKTSRRQRMVENADTFDFELSADEMSAIDALDEDRRHGADPHHVPF